MTNQAVRMAAVSLVSDLIPRQGTFPELSVLMGRIASTFAPEDVVLFGSRAKGTARPDSDWDILVNLPQGADENLLDPMVGWQVQRGSGVYADVICATKQDFIEDISVVNSLTNEIKNHAVRLR